MIVIVSAVSGCGLNIDSTSKTYALFSAYPPLGWGSRPRQEGRPAPRGVGAVETPNQGGVSREESLTSDRAVEHTERSTRTLRGPRECGPRGVGRPSSGRSSPLGLLILSLSHIIHKVSTDLCIKYIDRPLSVK